MYASLGSHAWYLVRLHVPADFRGEVLRELVIAPVEGDLPHSGDRAVRVIVLSPHAASAGDGYVDVQRGHILAIAMCVSIEGGVPDPQMRFDC